MAELVREQFAGGEGHAGGSHVEGIGLSGHVLLGRHKGIQYQQGKKLFVELFLGIDGPLNPCPDALIRGWKSDVEVYLRVNQLFREMNATFYRYALVIILRGGVHEKVVQRCTKVVDSSNV